MILLILFGICVALAESGYIAPGIETYDFSIEPASSSASISSGAYINALIPPDASVLSFELIGTSGKINLTDFSFQGSFNLRCYKFAQATVEFSDFDGSALINFRVQVNRNTFEFAPCNDDDLADEIMERLKSCPGSGSTLPGLAFANLENADQWRGYPLLPVEKILGHQLPQQNVDYLVITSDDRQSLIGELLDWKQELGLNTFVMSTQTIDEIYLGNSTQLKAREFLRDAFNSWHMEYVLIVGNVETLPPISYTAYDPMGGGDDTRTTDYYYMTLEQPIDTFSFTLPTRPCVDFPDFILGRFPFDDLQQITNLVEKTLSYEQDSSPGLWARTNLHVFGEDSPMGKVYYLTKDRPNPSLIFQDGNLSFQELADFVKQGVGSVYIAAHATSYGWWLGGTEWLDLSNCDQLSTSRLPVIFTIGCHSGKFDAGVEGSNSIAVRLLAKSDGGAVAIVSGTSFSPYGDEVYLSAYNSWTNCPLEKWQIPDSNYDVGRAFFYYAALNPQVEYMILLGDPSIVLATANYDIAHPPNILVLSPENETFYTQNNVSLTFTVDEPTDWIGYSLNRQVNVTATGNTTLTNLPDGSHDVLVYANDTAGNMGTSNLVRFTVDTTPPNITYVSQIPETDVQPGQTVKVTTNVTDHVSGIEGVKLAYFLDDSNIGIEFPMTFNSTTGLYVTPFGIPGQQADTHVRYTITAYDNAGNSKTDNNDGQYYVYTVIPEFPSRIMLSLFMITTLLVMISRRRKHTRAER